jgi:small conductance mechanosensitive channel
MSGSPVLVRRVGVDLARPMGYEGTVTLFLALPTYLALPTETPTPVPAPSVSPTPDCAKTSDLCQWIFEQTGQRWLASGSYYLLLKPAQILLIVVLAVVARYVLHRTINRLVRSTTVGSVPTILKPLKERLPSSIAEATTIFPERRRQRAEAIGSVLRSAASVSVYTIAILLALGELGLDLGPLLASAGIVGVALGFGAQTLVKDLLAGLSMLLEDQYGVGDVVDVGEASGTVEAVGLRITTIRDARGVLWYIRNGEIVRVGNKSQGWAMVMVDVPIGFASVDHAVEVLRSAGAGMADDPAWAEDLIEPPDVLGVEQITVDGAVVRTTVKTSSEAQWRVGRELRRRLTEALTSAGITSQISNSRLYLRPAVDNGITTAGTAELGTEGGSAPVRGQPGEQ